MDNIDLATKTLGCKEVMYGRFLLIFTHSAPLWFLLARYRRIPSPRFLGEILQVGVEMGYLDSDSCACGLRCSWVHQTPRETCLQ